MVNVKVLLLMFIFIRVGGENQANDDDLKLESVGLKINRNFSVLFKKEGILDNAQDFLEHHIMIPLRFKIEPPQLAPSCFNLKVSEDRVLLEGF